MPKKSNQKRADGRIAVQVYLGVVDGKRKYKTVYGRTQKEADEKADELRAKLRKGMDVSSRDDTFSKWSERWIAAKSVEIGNSQLQSYTGYLKHLSGRIGNYPIAKINTCDIQLLISDLAAYNPNTGKPSAKKTLTDIKNTAKQIFDFAIDNRVIDYNPCGAVKIPKNAPKDERRALTEEEQSWIINTPHRMQTAAMVMLFSGLRRGELIPLRWSDIDLKNRTISVTKSVDLSTGRAEVKQGAKTAAGVRTVNIPQILVNYLKDVKRENLLVCPSLSGKMYTATSWRTSWRSYLYDLDVLYGKTPQRKSKYDNRFSGITIDEITPHMLRHTFCTMLYKSGVDVLTAKEQMGHSDIKTTLSIYTHLDKKFKTNEMSKLDEFLNNASQMQVKKG